MQRHELLAILNKLAITVNGTRCATMTVDHMPDSLATPRPIRVVLELRARAMARMYFTNKEAAYLIDQSPMRFFSEQEHGLARFLSPHKALRHLQRFVVLTKAEARRQVLQAGNERRTALEVVREDRQRIAAGRAASGAGA